MKISIVKISADSADVSIFDENDRECCRLLVQTTEGKVNMFYDLYNGSTHGNIVASIPPANTMGRSELNAEERSLAIARPLQTVACVKLLRSRLNVSLTTAKQMVDAYRESVGFDPYKS